MPVSRSIGPVSGGNELEQPDGVRVQRVGEELLRLGQLDDLARVHDRDPVGELEQQRQVVRDEQHREAELALQLLELLQDLALDDDVERGRRLVHDHELRLERERHRDDHALTHAAGELVRVRAHAAAVDPDEVEQVAGPLQRVALARRARAPASCPRTGRRRA